MWGSQIGPPAARRISWLVVALGAMALAAIGCGGEQSTLEPRSEPAREIETLWWVMFWISVVVFAGAVFLLALAWLRRRREGLPLMEGSGPEAEAPGGQKQTTITTGLVIAFGIVIPVVVVIGTFAYANVGVIEETSAPDPQTTPLTVEVRGNQWWWEIRYPGTPNAITANELHIPARTRVNLVGESDDVIHSFWVPQLNRKIDLFPGRTNRVLLYADRPGRFRGQCAEFCGDQHARMALRVYADEPADFRRYLAQISRPRPAPVTREQQLGERVFLANQCASCHTIRGTPARGEVGPDLTHLKMRETLAALTIPNSKGHLAGWVLDPQRVKPGNKMPALDLSGPELQALLEYLESLR